MDQYNSFEPSIIIMCDFTRIVAKLAAYYFMSFCEHVLNRIEQYTLRGDTVELKNCLNVYEIYDAPNYSLLRSTILVVTTFIRLRVFSVRTKNTLYICSFVLTSIPHVYTADMSTLVISMLLELFGLGRHLCICYHLLSNGNRLPSM